MLNRDCFTQSSLCVVGNVNRDLKAAPIAPDPKLFTDGETSLSSLVETIGGGGANSACAAATLGSRVAFAGKVGADGLGDRLNRTLLARGIRTHLAKDPSVQTGTSIALSFHGGHRHFLSCLPASEALRFEDIDLRALDGCTHLLRADIWFSEPMLYEGNEALLKIARQRRIATSMDLNWDPRWGHASLGEVQSRKDAVRSVLSLVDIAHGNARELQEFCDAPDLEAALKILMDWGVRSVLVHLGEKGAGLFQGGRMVVEPAMLARTRVNMTGTGDVLSVCMMLLHERSELSIPARLQLANSIVTEFIEGQFTLIPQLLD